MLIVTPQIDRRRDGLPSSSGGGGRGGGRKDGEGQGEGEEGKGGGDRAGSICGRGEAGGGEGNPWMLLSFLSSCVFLGWKGCPLLGGGSWATSIDIIILGFGRVAKI